MSTGRRWRPSLHYHLAWCLSLRRDFPLEPFACRLASEDVNEHAQRLVAVIARRASSCCASMPSIAFLSRPDHNAAALFTLLMFAPELSSSAIAPAAITQFPDGWRSRRRGQARSPSGTERSGVA